MSYFEHLHFVKYVIKMLNLHSNMHVFHQVSTVHWVRSLQSPVLRGHTAQLLALSP